MIKKTINRQFERGFTLLELLVVISILGILMAMGAVAFSTAQSKGRDAKRRADIQQAQKGFEQYFADNGAYAACPTMAEVAYLPGGLPTDPRNVSPHVYSCAGTAATYCICAQLESEGTGNASDGNCTYATGGDFQCASNLQ